MFDKPTDKQIHVDRQIDRQINGWMDGQTNGWIDGWMNGWMDRQRDGWMDWTDEQMDWSLINKYIYMYMGSNPT